MTLHWRRNSIALVLGFSIAMSAACGDSPDGNPPGPNGPATPQSADSLSAATDADLYLALAIATAVFDNASSETVYLPGCAPFEIERRLGGVWMGVGPPFVCVWAGFAAPVEPDELVETDFDTPGASGLYRLRYDYGEGCDPNQPFSAANCERTGALYSNEFEVVREECGRAEPGCQVFPGAPTLLCPDLVNRTGPDDVCTRDPSTDRCGYEILSCP